MANNPYVNKVQTNDGRVLIDLTGDSVTAGTMAYGVTAHDKSGAVITGTLYGIGSLYATENVSTNPATILGFGTWRIRARISMTWDNAESLTWNEIEQYTWNEIENMTWYIWKRIS